MATLKFRCDRDALSEALQTVQRGVSSRPGIPALTGVLIEAADGGELTLITTDLEVSARLTISVAGDRVGDRAGAGAPAGRHGQEPVERARRGRDRPEPGHDPLCGVRGHAAAAPGRGLPGAAGAERDHRDGRGGRVRRGDRAGGTRRVARRGPSGAHRRAARGQPRGRRDGRDRLVPARRRATWSRAPRARRRRSCPSERCPRPAARPRRTRSRPSRSSSTRARCRSRSAR